MDWMISHHHSIGQVLSVLQASIDEMKEDGDLDDISEFFLLRIPNLIDDAFYNGFDGEIYASFGEFQDSEMLDEDYVRHLCDMAPDDEYEQDYKGGVKTDEFVEELESEEEEIE